MFDSDENDGAGWTEWRFPSSATGVEDLTIREIGATFDTAAIT